MVSNSTMVKFRNARDYRGGDARGVGRQRWAQGGRGALAGATGDPTFLEKSSKKLLSDVGKAGLGAAGVGGIVVLSAIVGFFRV